MNTTKLRVFVFALGFLGSTAFVPLCSAAWFDLRLHNISARARVGSGESGAAIIGFTISPNNGPLAVLIRASGLSLTQPAIGLAPDQVLSNPRIEVYDSNSVKLMENDDWKVFSRGPLAQEAAFQEVGAFPFTSERDAALHAVLPPGGYTVKVTGDGTSTGLVLVEVYDYAGSSQLINLSALAEIQTGANIAIAGFIVAPDFGLRSVLIRAIGPTLSEFNVANPLANPVVTVFDSTGRQIASNDNWGLRRKTANP